ncbi:hypothetical protein [Bradyrhizobium sp. WSM3983]|uniref:hypothetical protein n=1 Tax=Bradyrhizobium sp. WSM3983 TaxID=1038867 RepID=UPI00040BFBE5|nr:hypothetical protein [Bradyrhizobium sp. WSM3983]
MAKVPREAVGIAISSQSPNIDDDARAIEPANSRATDLEVDGTHGDGGKNDASIWPTHPQDMPVQAVIGAVLEVNDINAVSRVSLDAERPRIDDIDPRAAFVSFYGGNLAHDLLSFVTPRIRHPDVLRAGTHAVLLERLAVTLSAAPEASAAREAIDILQQELRRLVLLRQTQNSLIKG